jgi:hypothetical protein
MKILLIFGLYKTYTGQIKNQKEEVVASVVKSIQQDNMEKIAGALEVKETELNKETIAEIQRKIGKREFTIFSTKKQDWIDGVHLVTIQIYNNSTKPAFEENAQYDYMLFAVYERSYMEYYNFENSRFEKIAISKGILSD